MSYFKFLNVFQTSIRRSCTTLSCSWIGEASAATVGRCPLFSRGSWDANHRRFHSVLNRSLHQSPKACTILQAHNGHLFIFQNSFSTTLLGFQKLPPPENSQSALQSSIPAHLVHGSDICLSEDEKMLLVKTEYQLHKEEGQLPMPSEVTEEQWQELVSLGGIKSRQKFFRYLFLKEMGKLNDKKKSKEKRLHSNKRHIEIGQELETEVHISYGLWRNSIFIKYVNRYIDNINHHKLVTANLYGQHIIFDNGFEEHMNHAERQSFHMQFTNCIGKNRSNNEPYYLHMCNFNADSKIGRKILKQIPNLFMDLHEENYLDLFPKDRLVYLTPHCKEDMEEYDHDAIYIIGNLVDKGNSVPLTLAKAKYEGIEMRKFPIERYLDWGIGGKSLTIDQVLGIMLDMKETGSWVKAFNKNIPPRKLRKQDHGSMDKFKKNVLQKRSSFKGIKSLFDD